MENKYYKVKGDSGKTIALIKEMRSDFSLEYLVMSKGKGWHKNDDYALSHINGYDSEDNSYDIAEEITESEAVKIVNLFREDITI